MSHLSIQDICNLAPVVPVLVIDNPDKAVPLAKALVAGGLKALEVTLRTPGALTAVRAMAEAVPEAVVGVGTLRSAEAVREAVSAGARFGVSPGLSSSILDAAETAGLPMLPGVATPSEAMAAAERGFEILKFFPAEANGGVSVLKAWASPLSGLRFCPTGGVNAKNASDYLALPNVVCVGGSWVAPQQAIDEDNWAEITALSKSASELTA
ncbi:MAG: bifunctional 4-hydroxy-2-oxoglutarate aldolase/2-dehydro-3-deoxy-phosphogluconate aldolase [Pseudomonadota bacterium]